MFYWIGMILATIGMGWSVYKTFKSRNILSPQMFLFVGILFYLYLPAVVLKSNYRADEGYNFAILVGVIGAFVASRIFPYNILEKNEAEIRFLPRIKYFQVFAYIYATYLIFEIVLTIIQYGSISAVFTANRIDSYLGESIISSSLVGLLFIEGLKIFYYMYIAYTFEKKKYVKFIAFCIIPMIHHRFTAVTRYDFIAMIGAMVIYVLDEKLYDKRRSDEKQETLEENENPRKKRIHFLKITCLGVVGIYLALVFMRVANYTRFGQTAVGIDLSIESLFTSLMSNDSLYYEYFHYLYDAIQDGRANFEYGLSWFVYPFVNMVPRQIWPTKPYTAFSARMTDQIYWGLTSGNPVVTFSMLGEGYAQLGVIGCFLAPLVFLGSRWINFKKVKQMKYGHMYTLILMFSLLTYMRSEAPIFYSVIDCFWLWFICKFMCVKKKINRG